MLAQLLRKMRAPQKTESLANFKSSKFGAKAASMPFRPKKFSLLVAN
jgi:hypothetical protein